MIRVVEFIMIVGLSGAAFIGIQIVRGGKRSAIIISVIVSLILLFFNAKLEDETGKGIVGNLYCKMVRCVSEQSARPGYSQPGPPIVGQGPVQPADPSMTGVFGSTYGPVILTNGGGTYPQRNGQLDIETVTGPTVTGTWSQPTGMLGPSCPGGGYRGIFRFDFVVDGFIGRWSACDDRQLGSVWDGWRPLPITYSNSCPHSVTVYLQWTDQFGTSGRTGNWTIPPYTDSTLLDTDGQPARTTAPSVDAFVIDTSTGTATHSGSNNLNFGGVTLGTNPLEGIRSSTEMRYSAPCTGAGQPLVVS